MKACLDTVETPECGVEIDRRRLASVFAARVISKLAVKLVPSNQDYILFPSRIGRNHIGPASPSLNMGMPAWVVERG